MQITGNYEDDANDDNRRMIIVNDDGDDDNDEDGECKLRTATNKSTRCLAYRLIKFVLFLTLSGDLDTLLSQQFMMGIKQRISLPKLLV